MFSTGERQINREANDFSSSLLESGNRLVDSSPISSLGDLKEEDLIPGWNNIYQQSNDLIDDEDIKKFEASIQNQITIVRKSFTAQEDSVQVEALLPSFVKMLYSEDAEQCSASMRKIMHLAKTESFATVLISSLDLCPALLHVAWTRSSNSILALKVLNIFASYPLGRSIIFRSQFFYSITYILKQEYKSQSQDVDTIKNCLSILNKLMKSLGGEIAAPLRAHELIEILTGFLDSLDPKILLLALSSLILVCSQDSKSRIRMARTRTGVERVLVLMRNPGLGNTPSLATGLADLLAILSTEDDLKRMLLEKGAQESCMAVYAEFSSVKIRERILITLRNLSDRQQEDNCDAFIQIGRAILANNDEEMKNSQILAAGMLCNLTANFKHNKLCFLEKDGIKYASALAKRVLATMSSDHSDEHVRLAIPLLGLIKNCSSNLPSDARSIRDEIGESGLLELLIKLTRVQMAILEIDMKESEASSNPGLACDFLISALGLLTSLSLNKKNRAIIYQNKAVTLIRDLLAQTMNLSAEYAPIYAHLDLHTLKKRALACLHTFVKDENIREQLVAAYTSPDRFDDLVQDLQEFVSLSGEGERRRFPKDSPMCQREALGIIAEFIKIPDVLSVVRSKEELQSDLKRLVHSPSEGVATYSAYILYQLNENANDNSFVPIPNQDVTDWDDSSINSSKQQLNQIVPPRKSQSRV